MRTSCLGLAVALAALVGCSGSSGDGGGSDAETDGGVFFFGSSAGTPSSGTDSGGAQPGVTCGATVPCGTGCCDRNGHCAGTLDSACGKSGACVDCTLLGQTCAAGACSIPASGSGASSGGSSGSASGASSGRGGSGASSGGSGRDAGTSRDAGGGDASARDAGGAEGGRDSGSGQDASTSDAGAG
jgi:hypothetical protein